MRGGGYNLVDQPWIGVADADGRHHEWGIRRVLHEAGRIRGLDEGEEAYRLPVLRLLMAIAYRIFPGPEPGRDPAEQWRELYGRDGFDPDLVDAYLDRWHDRFDLFDPVRPFLQYPGLSTRRGPRPLPLADPVARGIGSGQAFVPEGGVDPARAALMLLSIQAWDTAGIKTAANGSPSGKGGREYPPHGLPGLGMCGLLDMAWMEGPDLYHTLLLGWAPPCRRSGDRAAWERPLPPSPGPVPGRRPEGPADCLTWTGRRVLLDGGPDGVTGAVVVYGDIVDPTTLHGVEPMARWAARTRKGPARRPAGKPSGPRPSLARAVSGIIPSCADDPGVCPSGIVWDAQALDTVGADLGLSLHTMAVFYGSHDSGIADVFARAEAIIPDWLTPLGGRILAGTALSLRDMTYAWVDYRIRMMRAAGGHVDFSPDRMNAVRAAAQDETALDMQEAMSRLLQGRADPVDILEDMARSVAALPVPDQPGDFLHRGTQSPVQARAVLEARLSQAVLGPDLSRLTDIAQAIETDNEKLSGLAKTAMGQGWTPASLARAYGMSDTALKRLRDADSPDSGPEGPDPRPAMLDARARIQTLSGLLIGLCRAGQQAGASKGRLEAASGLSHMTLHRRLARPTQGAGDPDDAWRVWMPENQGADGLEPHAAALVALALATAAGRADGLRLQDLLQSWERRPSILRDGASGLRILPSTEWRLQPRTGALKREKKQPLRGRRGRPKRLDADDDKRIARLYDQGKATVNELAARYHVSAGTIYGSLKRSGGRRALRGDHVDPQQYDTPEIS